MSTRICGLLLLAGAVALAAGTLAVGVLLHRAGVPAGRTEDAPNAVCPACGRRLLIPGLDRMSDTEQSYHWAVCPHCGAQLPVDYFERIPLRQR